MGTFNHRRRSHAPHLFEHAEFFPNNRINSVELAKALQKVVAKRTEETGEPPRKVKILQESNDDNHHESV